MSEPEALSTQALIVTDTPDRSTSNPAPATSAPRASLRKRLVALLAILAVPAMAAPGDFGAIAGDAPGAGGATEARYIGAQALPFEQPGMSFPGSAFFYLADPPAKALVALPEDDPYKSGAEGGREIGALIDAGPAARAFVSGQRGFAKAQQCLAQAVWYEAASESEAGQRAVAQVVLNRVAHPSWPSSVCGVVFEGAERSTGCQFSFTCDGSLSRRAKGASWDRAQRIAGEALAGSVYAPIGHATHYHTLWVDPYWAKTLAHVGTIGAHRFYRNRGKTGEKAAFTARYQGYEPALAPALAGIDEAPVARPADAAAAAAAAAAAVPAIEDAAQGPLETDNTSAAAASPEPYSAAGQAREAFARSGQWKVDPATLDLSTPPEKTPDAPPEDDR